MPVHNLEEQAPPYTLLPTGTGSCCSQNPAGTRASSRRIRTPTGPLTLVTRRPPKKIKNQNKKTNRGHRYKPESDRSIGGRQVLQEEEEEFEKRQAKHLQSLNIDGAEFTACGRRQRPCDAGIVQVQTKGKKKQLGC